MKNIEGQPYAIGKETVAEPQNLDHNFYVYPQRHTYSHNHGRSNIVFLLIYVSHSIISWSGGVYTNITIKCIRFVREKHRICENSIRTTLQSYFARDIPIIIVRVFYFVCSHDHYAFPIPNNNELFHFDRVGRWEMTILGFSVKIKDRK